jgi:hypothetical protein
MSEAEIEIRPEAAEAGECRSCRQPIWWVVTTGGSVMPLDARPHDEGNIEMTRVEDGWRAEVLAQVESLFDVQRPRWRSHFTSCPQAAGWRRQRMPEQRVG